MLFPAPGGDLDRAPIRSPVILFAWIAWISSSVKPCSARETVHDGGNPTKLNEAISQKRDQLGGV